MTTSTGRQNGIKPDPYASFRNDRDRLWALISRDFRFVICTVAIVVGGTPATPSILQWLWRVVGM